ncbi:MAG: exo-alpha-sialidase [Saprospiraceae bacterium]|nr:exo-alpha-sialidase [Saprospiraceae bacterium]
MKLIHLVVCVIFLSQAILRSQELDPQDIFIANTHGITQFRIPALITTNSGTLIAVCDARVDREGDPPNNVDQVLRRSFDNGNTWESLVTILDFPNKEGAGDPQLIQDPQTNRIFLFYGYCPGRNELINAPIMLGRHLSLQYIFSDDEGISWSLPIMVEYGLKKDGWHSLWPCPGRGTVLSDGTLVVPISGYDTKEIFSHLVFSKDHGETWQISGRIGVGINEATLVELSDGTLLVNARNDTKKRAIITSGDHGESWSEISYHPQLVEPTCQGSFIKTQHKNQDILLFSNPDDSQKRQKMTIKVSFDNGQTWPVKKLIYSGPSAYSCLTALADGNIGILYENGEKDPYDKISFVSLDLDWLTEVSD